MEFLPFSKLTKQSIPPRVRNVLESCYQVAWRELEVGVKRTLEEFERELFRQAERAETNDAQNRCFETLKEVRKKHAQVLLGMRDTFQMAMLGLLSSSGAEDGKLLRPGQKLSLVDNTELEEELALTELAAKTEMRGSQALSYLAVRFAVISGGAPISADAVPVGPHVVLRCLAEAFRPLDMHVKMRVGFYRTFDKLVLLRFSEILDAINRQLVDLRILPNLNLGLGRKAPASASSDSGKSEEPDAPQDLQVTDRASAASAPSAPAANIGRATPNVEPPTTPMLQESLAMPTRVSNSAPVTANPTLAQRPSVPFLHAQPDGNSPPDLEMFTTLRELLGGRRASEPVPINADGSPAQAVSSEDVQSVLTVLQSQPSAPVMAGGRWVSRRISHIKQDLNNQLRAMNGGRAAQLPAEDSDTMDLVGMLFDHILKDTKPTSTSHALITKLQVPMLKLAIRDKSFFARRNHPARQLLNTIAETSMLWVEDDEADRPLIQRMQMVVDRVVADYDTDDSVFESLAGDLGKHITTLQRKAEVSEKRYVEAAKGRERLDVARRSASEAITVRVKDRALPPLVSHLLEGAWADVLALTELRQSADSPLYHERLQAAEQLVRCFDLAHPVSRQEYVDLRPVLEEGLGLVGFHPQEAERTLNAVGELVVEGEALLPALAPEVEQAITELVKNKTRLGQDQEAPKVEVNSNATPEKQSLLKQLRKEEKLDLTVKEQQTLERLKQLPFGTWFEFTVNQQGETVRRRLSWFSPVTSNCLFVNTRGAKAEEKTLEQLARDLVRGNVKIWEAKDESLIDRTWKSIKETLKTWTKGERTLSDLMSQEA